MYVCNLRAVIIAMLITIQLVSFKPNNNLGHIMENIPLYVLNNFDYQALIIQSSFGELLPSVNELLLSSLHPSFDDCKSQSIANYLKYLARNVKSKAPAGGSLRARHWAN